VKAPQHAGIGEFNMIIATFNSGHDLHGLQWQDFVRLSPEDLKEMMSFVPTFATRCALKRLHDHLPKSSNIDVISTVATMPVASTHAPTTTRSEPDEHVSTCTRKVRNLFSRASPGLRLIACVAFFPERCDVFIRYCWMLLSR
jgi:hypothetical protein